MDAMSNRFGHTSETTKVTNPVPEVRAIHSYDAEMVTRSAQPRRLLYLVEWRKHLKIKPDAIAEAFGIERESVHRMEREQNRLNAGKIAKYADALGVLPEQLWRPPTVTDAENDALGLTPAEREAAMTLLAKLTNPANSSKPTRRTK